MPNTNRYLTCGVDSTIPLEIQLFWWECVERMPAPKDYLQVFELKPVGIVRKQASIIANNSSAHPENKLD